MEKRTDLTMYRDYRIYESGHDKLNNTIASDPIAYKPFPAYNTPGWKKKWHGEHVPCLGPRNVMLNESTDDEIQVYRGVPKDFPPVYAGGYDVIGLDDDVCFDRYSRYGPYGYGDDEYPEEVKDWKAPLTVPEWPQVRSRPQQGAIPTESEVANCEETQHHITRARGSFVRLCDPDRY
jgi:hypothetical protein